MEDTCRKGVKRKREEEDDELHAWQRKSILDLSMGKLRPDNNQNTRRLEPCLRRSVLILNTLKHIESELAREGVHSHQSSEAAMNEIPEMSMAQLMLDPLPDMSSFVLPLPVSPVPMSVDASQGGESENGDYLSLADSGIVNLLPCRSVMASQDQALSQTSSSLYGSVQSQNPAMSPLSDSPFFYSSEALDSRALSVPAYDGAAIDMMPSLPDFTPNSLLPNPVLELPKMYEVGDSNNNSATTSGPYNTSSSSLGGEVLSEAEVIEFLHSLQEASDTTSTSALPASSSSASVLNAQCSTFCRQDSMLDELDSIMQVLVGI
ncbi:uncharacterized protein LOC143296523 [Babylonia areolata]|uniref:uncharacterized protein LOC143296523 n=1 Tax=Babylonia areolata TaxID=304850 RepID=UPI003FD5D2BC